jgi:type I restriction enzyme, S subunit
MIHNLKPYPAYKNSGVPWLGDVPAHWAVRRIRNATEMRVSNVDKHTRDDEVPVRLCNYVDVYKHDRIRHEMPFMRGTASPEEIARFRLERGDVLITKDSEAWNDIGVPALVEEPADDLICGYHLALLRPFRDRLHGEYLFRAFQSTAVAYQFHVEANGVTRYGLSHAAIKSIWLPLPPLPEQAAIVRFIDHADRRIRRYIRAKQKLIKLLEEEKHAIIHRFVTRGLDPNVRLKPSGLTWTEQIPEHWSTSALGRLTTRIGDGLHGTPEYVDESPYHFINGNNLLSGKVHVTQSTRCVSEGEYEKHKIRLDETTLLLSINGTIGSVGYYHGESIILGKSAAYINCGDRLSRRYLFFLLRSPEVGDLFRREATGTTILNLSLEAIRHLPTLLPPRKEQAEIASFLECRTSEFTELIRKAQHEIELLREYRTRLIADVVTGKLDVREAAGNLPAEPEESERPLATGEFDKESDVDLSDPDAELEG